MIMKVQNRFSAALRSSRRSRATARCGLAIADIKVRKDDIVMNIKRNALLAVMGLVLAGGAASGASAQPLHPRRAEVNERLVHQTHRIQEARREGDLTPREARRLHPADYRIHRQEVRFVHRHGGYLTRHEQRRLNREENRVGRHIPG